MYIGTYVYAYDAFGVEHNPDPYDSNPFRYCGEYFDAETGTYYLRARYYVPRTGRFMTEDPIRSGLNWYTYCGGNPVMFVDPWGLVDVLLGAYAGTYEGAIIDWNHDTKTATVTWNGITLSVQSTAENNRGGHIYVDDSLFVNTFGIGNKPLVVYQDASTQNVSIRANFNIHGWLGERLDVDFYKKFFLEGIEYHWSGSFGFFNVSTYTGEHEDGIPITIFGGAGISRSNNIEWNWSPSDPGSLELFLHHNNGNRRTTIDFMWLSAHEFGHLLGVDEVYYPHPRPDGIKSIFNEAGTHVQSIDIAMILKAWRTGVWQTWIP